MCIERDVAALFESSIARDSFSPPQKKKKIYIYTANARAERATSSRANLEIRPLSPPSAPRHSPSLSARPNRCTRLTGINNEIAVLRF